MASNAPSPGVPTALTVPFPTPEAALAHLRGPGFALNDKQLIATIQRKAELLYWLTAFDDVQSGVVAGWISRIGSAPPYEAQATAANPTTTNTPTTDAPRQFTLLFFKQICAKGKAHKCGEKAHKCPRDQWVQKGAFENHFRKCHLDSCKYKVKKEGKVEKNKKAWACGCGVIFYDAATFMTHIWDKHMSAEDPQPVEPLVLGAQLPFATTGIFPTPAHSWTLHGPPASLVTGGAGVYPIAPPMSPPIEYLYQSLGAHLSGPSRNNDYSMSAPSVNYNGAPNSDYNGAHNSNYHDPQNNDHNGSQNHNPKGNRNGTTGYWPAGTQSMPSNQIHPDANSALPSGWEPINGSQ